MNCQDRLLEDIVKVEIYPSSELKVSLPPTIALSSIVETTGMFGTPALTCSLVQDDTGVMLNDLATLKIANARQQGGNVYTHDLQMVCVGGRKIAEDACNSLIGRDFSALCYRNDGSRVLCYPFPNGSNMALDFTQGASGICTIKVTMLSMSNVIDITTT